ncbi:MAG: metal-sensitive transcriptional regulator [Candidatus Malihini olakiniferum]
MASSRKCEFCTAATKSSNFAYEPDVRHVVQPRKNAAEPDFNLIKNQVKVRLGALVRWSNKTIKNRYYIVNIINQSAARSVVNTAANQLLADHTNGICA